MDSQWTCQIFKLSALYSQLVWYVCFFLPLWQNAQVYWLVFINWIQSNFGREYLNWVLASIRMSCRHVCRGIFLINTWCMTAQLNVGGAIAVKMAQAMERKPVSSTMVSTSALFLPFPSSSSSSTSWGPDIQVWNHTTPCYEMPISHLSIRYSLNHFSRCHFSVCCLLVNSCTGISRYTLK